MVVFGIDPGTALLGWGVIDTGSTNQVERARCLGYDCVRTDGSMTDSQRLLALANSLSQLLSRYQPDLVAVEELFFTKNQKTAITVAQARGVVLLTVEQLGLSLVEFTPLEVKQALTGYGRAEKAQVQQMVKLLLHLETVPQPDDAADALAVAVLGAQTARYTAVTKKVVA